MNQFKVTIVSIVRFFNYHYLLIIFAKTEKFVQSNILRYYIIRKALNNKFWQNVCSDFLEVEESLNAKKGFDLLIYSNYHNNSHNLDHYRI